jgi:aminopeptidase-like protein/aminoglycoside N3'-acetyltransferase
MKEKIINLLVEKTKNKPASIHLDLVGLIRLAKNKKEMMNGFYEILLASQDKGANIVIPNYTYSLTKNETFNFKTSIPTIGKVYEYLSENYQKKSHDGNFSYIVFSNSFFQNHLKTQQNYETFGKNSLIDELYNTDGYLCALGCGLDQLTEIHYIENLLKVRYRFNKKFVSKIKDDDTEYVQTNTYFCRDNTLGLKSDFTTLYDDLKKENLIEYWNIDGDFEIEAIKFKTIFNFIKEKISHENLYLCIEDDPMKLLKELYPLHRTLVSDDTDQAYEIVKNYIPKTLTTKIEEYKCGREAWYWQVPYRYKVNKAILKDEDGKVYADFFINYLHIWSYSISVNKKVTFKELEKHLYFNEKRPNAIPWYFKFYDKTWGFCISYNDYLSMPKDKNYYVEIDSEFLDSPGFKTMSSYLDYGCKKDFLLTTNICHPNQVNDSITGLVVAVEIAKRLSNKPIENPTKNLRFLFCPETIGSIVYLSQNEDLIEKISSATFIEMVGHKNDDAFILQLSRNKDDLINKIYRYVLDKQNHKYSVRPFARWNDEGVINGPGVNIPCPFIMRGEYLKDENEAYDNKATRYYDEYHTSDDNPDIISYEKLIETADMVEEVVRIYATNYIPKQTKKGIIFLAPLGLHVSFWDNPELCGKIEKILLRLEGNMSIFEISNELDMDYWECKDFIDALYAKKVIEKVIYD